MSKSIGNMESFPDNGRWKIVIAATVRLCGSAVSELHRRMLGMSTVSKILKVSIAEYKVMASLSTKKFIPHQLSPAIQSIHNNQDSVSALHSLL
jgi:hypothetical protein